MGGLVDRLGVAPWVAVVFAAHLALLARFWFNAPVLDDYDAILDSMGAMARVDGLWDWLKLVFSLQNEHRLAGTRLMAQILAWTTGGIDFRALMLLGTLFMLGTFTFIWLEFRKQATGPIAAAAAFLLLQWSYNEALLMASASTAHLGVVFFSFGALFFALRPGKGSAVACVVGGILAVYSQANGLFVLPLAGIACVALKRMRRGGLFIGVAVALWILYFTSYVGNPHHPSVLKSLEDPVKTIQLFLVIVGGVVPSLPLAQLYGAAIVAALGWVIWKGVWRQHPTAFLWIAFVLISAGTVAAARVGFGLFHGSRYAVNAALLMAILTFAIHSATIPWRPRLDLVVVCGAALAWAAITIVALPEVRERSFRGRLLVEMVPEGAAPGASTFAGMHHPNHEHAVRILRLAEKNGWYFPPRYVVMPPAVVRAATRPVAARSVGVMDEVTAEGRTVVLRGWTDVAAIVPGRKFTIYPDSGIQAIRFDGMQVREDVAVALQRPDTLLAGFRIVAEYPSEADAQEGAKRLCIFVEAPGRELTQIVRTGMTCN